MHHKSPEKGTRIFCNKLEDHKQISCLKWLQDTIWEILRARESNETTLYYASAYLHFTIMIFLPLAFNLKTGKMRSY